MTESQAFRLIYIVMKMGLRYLSRIRMQEPLKDTTLIQVRDLKRV